MPVGHQASCLPTLKAVGISVALLWRKIAASPDPLMLGKAAMSLEDRVLFPRRASAGNGQTTSQLYLTTSVTFWFSQISQKPEMVHREEVNINKNYLVTIATKQGPLSNLALLWSGCPSAASKNVLPSNVTMSGFTNHAFP